MKRLLVRALLPALLLGTGGAASAQEWQVARERFAFAGSRLEIRIDVETEGTLRILRGAPGSVRVAGRAISGFTAAGLTDDEQLTLTALADGPVHYMVSVPEGVWVSVRFPDRYMSESVASHDRGRTFEWQSAGTRVSAGNPTPGPVPMWTPPAATDPFETTLFTTFTGDVPPAEVSLPDLRWVRSITVRIEGDRFRVATSRPLGVEPGDTRRLVIRPAAPPMDIVLGIPEATPDFTLLAGDATALRLTGAGLVTLCAPVTDQRLSGGRRWVTFTPVDGALECGPPATVRHEG